MADLPLFKLLATSSASTSSSGGEDVVEAQLEDPLQVQVHDLVIEGAFLSPGCLGWAGSYSSSGKQIRGRTWKT